ncbi:MAG: tryptophan synthase subunit alpha [Nitriliruptoraceae bacterium]
MTAPPPARGEATTPATATDPATPTAPQDADVSTRGPDRIAAAFARAAAEDRAALVIYLTAAYPDLATSRACFEAAVEAGADVLEVGLPFSDPMMDGPIIQAANQHVLDTGIAVSDQLALVADLGHLDVPKLAMTYVTIADTRGYAAFAAELAAADVSGVILPDLPVAEATAWLEAAEGHGLATVFLASSVSTEERLAAIGRASSGWVYAAGLLGVTGVKSVAGDVTRELVGRVRRHTDLPVAVGIGVRDRSSAAEVARYADGVIVGSAVVRAVGDGDAAGAPDRVAALVRQLRSGVADR